MELMDTRKRCRKCNVPIRNDHGVPYTRWDDVDGNELCQWCFEEQR